MLRSLCAASLMSAVYEDMKDKDGFLYIKYSGENTFGGGGRVGYKNRVVASVWSLSSWGIPNLSLPPVLNGMGHSFCSRVKDMPDFMAWWLLDCSPTCQMQIRLLTP